MKSIWIFGDSFSASYKPDGVLNRDWRNNYVDWKGYTPKVYGEILANQLNIKLINKAVGGSDNYTIFQTFCNVSDLINKNDIVIFGWTSTIRFRLVAKNDNWESFLPNWKSNHNYIDSVSERTINEILINRESKKYVDEINSWIKLINVYLKNNKVIHWNYESLPYSTKINGYHLNKFESIYTETNGEIDDGHFSETGQLKLSEFFLDKILNPNKLL